MTVTAKTDMPRDRARSGSRRAGKGNDQRQATEAGLDLLRVLGWMVVHDVVVPGPAGRVVDHVLAGPSGVYVVNTVSADGALVVREDLLVCGNADMSAELAEVTTAAEDLRQVVGGRPVAPLLCFVRGEEFTSFVAGAAVCSTENVLDVLTSQKALLDGTTQAAIARSLTQALTAADGPRIAPPPVPAPESASGKHRHSLRFRRGKSAPEESPVETVADPVADPVVELVVELVETEPVVNTEVEPEAEVERAEIPQETEDDIALRDALELAARTEQERADLAAERDQVAAERDRVASERERLEVQTREVAEQRKLAALDQQRTIAEERRAAAEERARAAADLAAAQEEQERIASERQRVVEERRLAEEAEARAVAERRRAAAERKAAEIAQERAEQERAAAARKAAERYARERHLAERAAADVAAQRGESIEDVVAQAIPQPADPPIQQPAGARVPERFAAPGGGARPTTERAPEEPISTGPSRASVMVALKVVAVAALMAGLVAGVGPRVGDLVTWGKGLVGATPAAAYDEQVTAAANAYHPDLTLVLGAPAAVQANAGQVPAGERAFTVPLQVLNSGANRWLLRAGTSIVAIDSLGIEHRIDRDVTGLRSGRPMPVNLRIKGGANASGLAVFTLPNGRTISEVKVKLSQAEGDTYTWKAD